MKRPILTLGAIPNRRLLGPAAIAILLSVVSPGRADESLARAVPADVGLFLELRQAEDLLTPLVEPQVWLTLAELAGQPAALKETEQWSQRVEQTVKMSPAEAIRALFAQRVAFVSESLRNTQDAVILCRPASPPRELIGRWQARPLPTTGRTSVYRLPYNVGLAAYQDLLVFGDTLSHGLFDRIIQSLEGKAPIALADDPDYQRLLARVPPDPDGVLFARLTPAAGASADTQAAEEPETLPAGPPLPELPRLLRDSKNVLLALHREDRVLRLSAVGDANGVAQSRDGSLTDLVANLPQETLLAWAGHVDYPGLIRAAAHLAERSALRVAFQLQEPLGTMQRLTEALNSSTCLAIGTVMPETRLVPAPPLPAAAVLITARDPAAAAEWSSLFHNTVDVYRLLSLKAGAPPRLPPIETITLAGREVERLDLSSLVSPTPEQTPLGELHLSWAFDGGVLIIATHSDWLRQVLEARQGRAPQLQAVLELSRPPAARQQDTIFVVQSGALADLGSLWLSYVEMTAPRVLDEGWWRNYQPGGEVRLGIQVAVDPEGHRLRVLSVMPSGPADGVLKPGDDILGCNPRRFATSQPVQEIKRGLTRRPNARWLDLLVERDRVVRVKRIPLPFVDPIEVLRRIVAIGRVVQRVVYLDDVPDAAGFRGYLTLELRADQRPLLDFPETPIRATSQPE